METVACPHCDHGYVEIAGKKERCFSCGGKGFTLRGGARQRCTTCNGTGHYSPKKQCEKCHGSGWIEEGS